MKKRHRWTNEQIEFLREGCQTFTRVEMVDKLKRKFDIDVNVTQVNTATRVHGIKCLKTRQARLLPIGAESFSGGYIYVKINDTSVWKNDWKLKHHIIWEKVNGPIPKGHQLLFVDGNKENTSIENLVLMKHGEMLFLNSSKLMTENIDSNKVAVQIAKLLNRTVEIKKRKNKTV